MWFGLTGVWWFLLALGYTLVGIGTVVAAALVLPWLVAKTAAEVTQHAADCQCGKCQDRRLKEYRHGRPNTPRAPDPRDVKPGRGGSSWKATTQLRVGMYVSGKDNSKTYRVTRLEKSLAGVVVVHLVNISTRKPSSIPVTSDRVDKPIWLVIADEGEWD